MSHEPTALVAVADGSEEIEFVSTVDTLARGGVKVTTASVEGRRQVNCSRGVSIVADTTIDDVHGQTFDAIALPGGMPGAVRHATSAWGAAERHRILALRPRLPHLAEAPARQCHPHQYAPRTAQGSVAPLLLPSSRQAALTPRPRSPPLDWGHLRRPQRGAPCAHPVPLFPTHWFSPR